MPDLFRYLEVIARVTGSSAGAAAQTDDELGARLFELQPQAWHAGTPSGSGEGLQAKPFAWSIAAGQTRSLLASTIDEESRAFLPRWLIFVVDGSANGVELRINSRVATGVADPGAIWCAPGHGRTSDITIIPINTLPQSGGSVVTIGYVFKNPAESGRVNVRGILLYERAAVPPPSPP